LSGSGFEKFAFLLNQWVDFQAKKICPAVESEARKPEVGDQNE
jgi:hypothetical protein